jgi:V8-like Glu-specific endopeptidase
MQGSTDRNDVQTRQYDLIGHYKNILKAGEAGGGNEGVESGEPDLSDPSIKGRLDATKATLYQIIKQHLGDNTMLYALADQIIVNADEALRIVRANDEEQMRQRPGVLASLETIVRTDGSRPSFMVRHGAVDLTTSPVGSWADMLNASAEFLSRAIACVGRVDVPGSEQGFEGTAFLIHENLVLTNRHVLQAAADCQADGTWKFKPDTAIDFGHEFRVDASSTRRALQRVVFSGAQPIKMSGPVDHTKLDLALIELEPTAAAAKPRVVLAVDKAPDWAEPKQVLFTIGYPANPGFGIFPPSLLEQLFQSTYGYKRLAPGLVMASQTTSSKWTREHDATTLGGNSGSILLVAGREHIAAGLHYGGRRAEPRTNWGHVLGLVLDETDGHSSMTLREHLLKYGVELIDRKGSGPL